MELSLKSQRIPKVEFLEYEWDLASSKSQCPGVHI